jgi:hypothetical protein
MGGAQISARETELAVTGELSTKETQRALMRLWAVFEAHACEVGGGERRARAANTDERPQPHTRSIDRGNARTSCMTGPRVRMGNTEE